MPIVVQDTSTKKNGNGVTFAFTFDFRAFFTSDLLVIVDGVTQVETTDYSIVLDTLPAEGGTVTFITAPPTGTANVFIGLNLPYTQGQDLSPAGDVPADGLDDVHDRLTLLIAQVKNITDLCFKIPQFSEIVAFDEVFPDPAVSTNRSKPFQYKSDGLGFETFTILSTDITSPITDEGDLIIGGSGGTPQKKVIGADGALPYVKTSVSGKLEYTAAPLINQLPHWNATDWTFSYAPDIGLNTNPGIPVNIGLAAVLSTNDVVYTLTSADGSTPSATNPVWIPFRSSTVTNGTITWAKMTATEVLTLPDGGTLGHTAADITAGNTKIRAYVYAMLNGTDDVELIVTRQALWSGDTVQSTTAIGTGSDDNSTLYSTTARTAKPITLIAVIEQSASTTAGTWTAVDNVANWTPGMRKTGDIVQRQRTTLTTVATTTATFTNDDTKPLISEGAAVALDVAIVPTSVVNQLEHYARLSFGDTATGDLTAIALFQDSETDSLSVSPQNDSTANGLSHIVLTHETIAGTVASTTFKIRIGGTGSTITINGNSGVREFGGSMYSEHVVQERYA